MNDSFSYRVWITLSFIVVFWIALIAFWLALPAIMTKIKPSHSLTVCIPPLVLDPEMLKKFEAETGIKIYVSYYDSASTLVSKLESSQGQGYDLLLCDDHTCDIIINHKLVQEIDKTKLSFLSQIQEFARSPYYDPNNNYTIAYFVFILGIAYNAQFFKQHNVPIVPSWELIFNPHHALKERICMTDDPRMAFLLGGQYLFPHTLYLATEQYEQIKELLKKQKAMVNVYSMERADNLLQIESCVAAVMFHSDYVRLQAKRPEIEFLIPQEGSFFTFDAFAIPKGSNKCDMIYQLINFLFRKEVVEHHMSKFFLCPAIQNADSAWKVTCATPQILKKLSLMRSSIPDKIFNQWWIEILA